MLKNNTWKLNKFQSGSLSQVVHSMNTLYGFMSDNEYNGAVIYNHDITHHPTFKSSFNNGKLFSAGGNYGVQKDEVYSTVMTFINTQLFPTQAYFSYV